jgi:uncharacterized protein
MKILIDIGHPAHVHYFKNFTQLFKTTGNKIHFVAREREHVFNLLKFYNFNFVSRGKGSQNILRKLIYLPKGVWAVRKAAKRFKPDVLLGFSNPYISLAGKIMGIPSIHLDDTENAKFNRILYAPFASKIITPRSFKLDLGKKQIRINAYFELFYLHPSYFKPNYNVFKLLNVTPNEKYAIIRFVAWGGNHDIGHTGISHNYKIKVINELEKYVKVFISSETELPPEIDQYRINLPSNMMHDALYFADILFGESATMASECAVLGTPAIYVNSLKLGYLEEEEKKYGLVHTFKEDDLSVEKGLKAALDIVRNDRKKEYKIRGKELVADHCNPTELLYDVVADVAYNPS